MIFLEILNRAVEESLLYRFENAKNGLKFEKFNQTLADFDGAIYHLRSVPNDRSKILVSITLNFFQELQEHGANEVLKREYGQYLLNKPEDGCSVSLLYDLEHLPEDYALIAQKAALLKRNCFAAVFEKFFEFHASMGENAVGCKKAVIHYRPDETLYISALADRVTVIFSTVFKESDDLIIAKVFLQELTEVRRRFDRAPQVLYSQSVPPSELVGTDAAVGDNVAYITFVLFPRHLTPQASSRTINLIHILRNYLHYHIKCSKGYIHRRMRAKTFEFIKILNRARPQFYCLNPVIQTGTSIMTTTTSMKSISSNSFVTENSITNGENGIDDHNHSNGIDDNKNNSNGSNNASMQTDRKSIMSTMKDTGSMSQQHQHLSTPSVQQTSSSSSSYTTTLPQSSDFMLNNGYI
ncbi:Actin- protein 2/3 complex subunit 2, variant 2 [Schistosoma haematobium]|uniref:Actin- protein 2/3 complex subunit 2, variant 2 n=2 Tax=Schistosoma haematobium TaxID=6185 RepID=A0A6A5DKZ8_SCHHA|nr:Actin- protein 2/3 complex subunit 2, variant 2 [Schistosoma haematobium]KAH9579268.1 Actin- protein 2/3 complex subunit 2, variant 2 [Schistosoma haematobium]CAH8630938.1 unnamed protein product [Schistosoma haematobium]CAH8637646.1 unnamed protein product [Schistosoma haematobium]